jgi:hypothetical protein
MTGAVVRIVAGLVLTGVGIWTCVSDDSSVYWYGALLVGPLMAIDGFRRLNPNYKESESEAE